MWRFCVQAIRAFVKQRTLWVIGALGLILVLLLLFGLKRDSVKLITTSQAGQLYSAQKIRKVIVEGPYIRLVTDEGDFKIYSGAINAQPLFKNYPVEVAKQEDFGPDLWAFAFVLGVVVWAYWMMRGNRSGQFGPPHHESASDNMLPPAHQIRAIRTQVTFRDVAGIKDVKEELEEIIDFLSAPRKYKDLDIRLPRGVLLVGPPGVGKTLIAKAVAGEAKVPFFYQSGASFVQIYVGMGAKRVSELFSKAKQAAPSIVFIDEIDAVGKARGALRNDEREATLNQLLTEMDGFEESAGVIVIAATNKVDVLDEALLRSGRFDRRIHISLPDIEERAKTLALYLAKKPHEVDLEEVARMTVGFNSAALATLANEAAIHAMRQGRRKVLLEDFEAVKERVLLGKRRILSYTNQEREIQLVYQGAKAVVAAWLDVEFEKIGIVTTRLLAHDHEIISKSQILNRIKVYLAGSTATQLAYKEKFTNAGEDIAQARALVRQLVQTYAMGERFVADTDEEERILEGTRAEVVTLLGQLALAHERVIEHLQQHENITPEATRAILRALF
jgi:cell division protease FtsH